MIPYGLALAVLSAASSSPAACDVGSIAAARRTVKAQYVQQHYEQAVHTGESVLAGCPASSKDALETERLWLLSDVLLAFGLTERASDDLCLGGSDWALPSERPAAGSPRQRAWKALAFNYARLCTRCDSTTDDLCRDGSWARKGYAEIASEAVHPSLPPMRFRAVLGPSLDTLVLARVEVADAASGRLIQSLDGGNESFVEAFGEDSVLYLGDPNFDGYGDITVKWCYTRPSCGQAIWLYDPGTGRFAADARLSGLSNLAYDAKDKSVRAAYGDGQEHIEERYEWRGQELVLLEKVTATHEGTVVERLVGGVMKVVEKRPPAP